MKNKRHILISAVLCTIILPAQSAICPDPVTSSLAWGKVPEPWEVSPFSSKPQGESGAEFKRADILIVGNKGIGVECTYSNSIGSYSIWWPTNIKRPDRSENNWFEVLSGYQCTNSIAACVFYPG